MSDALIEELIRTGTKPLLDDTLGDFTDWAWSLPGGGTRQSSFKINQRARCFCGHCPWKPAFVGFVASLPEAAIAEKHIILLKKESRNWISY